MSPQILVPLDGSPLAERAIPQAAALAPVLGARLVLLDAVSAFVHESRVTVIQEAHRYLNGVVARLADQGLDAEKVVPYGHAAEKIVEEARLRSVDLIVMATHGRDGVGRWVYGSTAEAVLARAPAPVLLVRAWQPEGVGPPPGERPKLLVPLDGSAFAEEALPLAAALATGLDGELVLVRAVPLPGTGLAADWAFVPDGDAEPEELQAEVGDYLDRLAERLRGEGHRVRPTVCLGPPAAVIPAVERDCGATMVVMTTHGRAGLSRLVLGSVADGVLRAGAAPLLLVRPRTLRAAPAQPAAGAGAGPVDR